jgi:predicted kinase
MTWETLSTASPDDILEWSRGQPWCRAMADCQQDAKWHAEGDVWTHTEMVCRQLPRLDEWPSLTDRERTVLTFTAIFHDAGKPLTSQLDPKSGRITSPKHAIKGEHLVRAALQDLGCPLAVREEVARMVRLHGRPVFLFEKPDPIREVVTVSWWVTNRLLYLFTLTDTRGRRTAEMTRPEENLHLWKLLAEEHDCFTQPYHFASDHARFLFFRKPTSNLLFVPHTDFHCTVTMMSGLPGSGKDSWLAKHRPELPVVSLDEIRDELGVDATDDQGEVIQLGRERCRELLRARITFAFNATNLLKHTRRHWIDLFADYGARIVIVYIEPPLATIHQQNQRRASSVPETVVRQLAAKCEPPTWAEAHDLIICDEASFR